MHRFRAPGQSAFVSHVVPPDRQVPTGGQSSCAKHTSSSIEHFLVSGPLIFTGAEEPSIGAL